MNFSAEVLKNWDWIWLCHHVGEQHSPALNNGRRQFGILKTSPKCPEKGKSVKTISRGKSSCCYTAEVVTRAADNQEAAKWCLEAEQSSERYQPPASVSSQVWPLPMRTLPPVTPSVKMDILFTDPSVWETGNSSSSGTMMLLFIVSRRTIWKRRNTETGNAQ